MMVETSDYLVDKNVHIWPTMPKYKARLVLTPDFQIHSTIWPNWWRRFWYWALLGWHWERE